MLASELSGYEKGAYTGAKRRKQGLFELADGGTLLLDEIGYMSLGLQAKLLKAIEENTFRQYHWPGNVRELRNAIKRAMIVNDTAETLQPEMIPVRIRQTNSLATRKWNSEQLIIGSPSEGVTFEEVERRLIAHTLKSTDWNKNRSARTLKILRPRLLRKVEKYGLEPN